MSRVSSSNHLLDPSSDVRFHYSGGIVGYICSRIYDLTFKAIDYVKRFLCSKKIACGLIKLQQ